MNGRVWGVVVLAIGTAACSGEVIPAASPDAGAEASLDASLLDASSPEDLPDATSEPGVDAGAQGPGRDAALPGSADGGRSDASASAPDAGRSDGGADAGRSDAGGTAGCGRAHAPGFQCFDETFAGKARRWCVDVAASEDPQRPLSLVFGLHGCGGSPNGARNNTAPQVEAGRGSFLFVYPAAAESCWDYSGTVDTAFITHLVTRLGEEFCLEPGRVFADGMSSGGMMASRLVCNRTARAAAAISLNFSCADRSAHPMWLYGGTTDSYYDSYIYPGLQEWLRNNGCSTQTEPLASGPCVRYLGCTAPVVWCSDARGHVWPNDPSTALIVDFFRAVP